MRCHLITVALCMAGALFAGALLAQARPGGNGPLPGDPGYGQPGYPPDQGYPPYGYTPPSPPVQYARQMVDMWGAIAISPQLAGVSGSSLLKESREAAEQQALDYCFPSVRETCKVVFTYVNGCVAVVKGDKDYDFQVAETEDEAKRISLESCAARQDTNCEVSYSVCSLPRW